MKIAFVSQPIDSVIPPYQNSVGACTWGSACFLAKKHDVVVYGLAAANDDRPAAFERNVAFRFLPESRKDNLVYKSRTRLSRAFQLQPVSTSPFYYSDYGCRVAQELGKQNFDVIHIQHCSQFAPVIREFNPNSKIVLHLHAEWFSQTDVSQLRRRLKHLDLLTTVSHYVTHQTLKLLPDLGIPCTTHYNGFDPSEFALEKDYAALTQRRERRILFAGGISPHKGIHVLIDAFKLVAEQQPDVRLDLSGPAGTYPIEETFDRSDRALTQQLAPFYSHPISLARRMLSPGSAVVPDYISQLEAKLPPELSSRVSFLGKIPREKLVERYYDCDLFVFPSLFAEGFGLPPVEAMAAGTPAIGTRSGAIVETIEHGETGLLVEKNNPRALADAILLLLSNAGLREKMGRAGRDRAMRHFTWQHVTEKMETCYEQISSMEASAFIQLLNTSRQMSTQAGDDTFGIS